MRRDLVRVAVPTDLHVSVGRLTAGRVGRRVVAVPVVVGILVEGRAHEERIPLVDELVAVVVDAVADVVHARIDGGVPVVAVAAFDDVASRDVASGGR